MKEYTWENVVTECEQLLGLIGHAEDPRMSNLPNAIRDLKHGMFPHGIRNREIIVCPKCKGEGKREASEIEDYHHNTYNYWDEVCENCDGRGRVILETIKITSKLTDKELELRPKKEDD